MLDAGTLGGNPPIERQLDVDRIPQLLIAVCVVLSGAVLLYLFGNTLPAYVASSLTGVFAALGIFFTLGLVFGICRVGGRRTSDAIALSLFETFPHGVIVTGANGDIAYANTRYMELFGASSSAEIAPPDQLLRLDGQGSASLLRLSVAIERRERAVEEVRVGSGSAPRWLRIEVRPIGLRDGNDNLTAWLVSDVTIERAGQESTFIAAQEAIDFLDGLPTGFFVARADGVILHLNSSLADLLGIDLTAFQRRELRFEDFVAGNGAALLASAPKAEDGTRSVDLDLIGSGDEAVPVHIVLRDAPSGDQTFATVLDRRSHLSSSRAFGAVGEDDGLAAIRFERFFNNAPIAIVSLAEDSTVIRRNAPFLRMFGDVMGDGIASDTRLTDMLPEEDRARLQASLNDAMHQRADIPPIDFVVSGDTPDSDRHFRLFVNSILRNARDDGEGETAIVYVVENTEQKAIESAYARGQKLQAMGELSGSIAHDFNNLLTAINLSVDHLLQSHSADDPSYRDIHSIKTDVGRAAALVRQLLAYARKQTLRKEVVDLPDVLADARSLLDRIAGHGVQLTMNFGPDPWFVKLDKQQFVQVASNLIANARDAMGGVGSVTINTRNVPAAEAAEMGHKGLAPADYVMIDVIDTGSGMPPEVVERIFEPFYTTKEVGKGTGLGLSMVYGTVKQSQGFIFADSEVGKGTRFRILLPRCEAPVIEDKAVAKGPVAGASEAKVAKADLTGTGRVLLVEDETSVRMGSMRALSARGYDVQEAADGLEALEYLEEVDGDVDIIVSDVVMPEMDGPTLLREMRERYGDTIKFVFVSGYAEDAFAKNLPENAEFSFLPKPYSIVDLTTKVKEVLKEG